MELEEVCQAGVTGHVKCPYVRLYRYLSSCVCGARKSESGEERNQMTPTRSKKERNKKSNKLRKDVEEVLRLSEMKLNVDCVMKDKRGVMHFRNYILLRHINTGSLATVKLGINIKTGSLEALKILSKKDFSMLNLGFAKYCTFLMLLDHPNVIRSNSLIKDSNGEFYVIAMEYADGGHVMSEDSYTKECTPMRLSRVKGLFLQMITGTQYLHSRGIIHGDLTLKNMLMSGERLKISDMDSAAHFSCPQRRRTTPAYCAPEIVNGTEEEPNYSYKSDVWALGICLYIMLHGRLPFPGTNKFQVYNNILEGKVEFRKDLSKEITKLLAGMLEPCPVKRFGMKEIVNNTWLKRFMLKKAIMESFNTEPMKNLGNSSVFATYKRGETIFKKGESGNTVFFILSGEVQVIDFWSSADKVKDSGYSASTNAEEEFPDEDEDAARLEKLSAYDGDNITFDLEYGVATNSMSEMYKSETTKMLMKLRGDGKRGGKWTEKSQPLRPRALVVGKGGSIGEISALRSIKNPKGTSPRVATCKALTKVKVMEIHVNSLNAQCLTNLEETSRQRVEAITMLETRKNLELIYNPKDSFSSLCSTTCGAAPAPNLDVDWV
ncbi:calcium/calmodulin-dependent protein kinase [Chloropicon primus]|uniref:Calcium/calmodulin-dependent protein kinase n=1 Tax=Chloropicon primus TaxID=1764295 RepID=A0A5B8MKL1_9CHLO|nr:calcium/calmodulin-dependent protein kinase [Chloropicon primus]|eukprot:QDZ21168.1 calcium/calmodulin-dependent protein kinase [Chloropicon primus]